MLSSAAVLLSVAGIGLGTAWYIYLALRGKIRPVLASWIIFGTTIAIGFWSYWNSPNHSLVGNIGNLSAIVSTGSILVAVALIQLCRKELRVKFSRFQVRCLIWSAGIVALWCILRFYVGNELAATISNVLTQILMVIGYTALAQKLWGQNEKTESLFTWASICISSILCLVPAIEKNDALGFLYGTRAAITSGITVCLILRTMMRERRPQGALV